MDKTCKLNADFTVAIQWSWSSARVRNTWVICPEVGDNSLKGELIPNVIFGEHFLNIKVGDRKA